MRDVAQSAGVSVMTVSRVLNDPDKVSEEMRLRVAAAVDAVGYLPNRLAGSLSSNRSNVIGLVLPNLRNSLYAETVGGISQALSRNDFHLMIAESGYRLDDERRVVEAFLAQRVSGLVLHNTDHAPGVRALIRRAGVPTVENGNLCADPIDMVVSYSNVEASRAMTLHLARLGYRGIGFVSLLIKDNERSRERRRGYLAALAELGRPRDERFILEMPPGLESGAEAVVRLMAQAPGLDAVFLAGDVLAIGALFECYRRGWSVPGRVALAGFDDMELMRHAVPTLTTIRLPREAIGTRSAELLLDRVQGRGQGAARVDLQYEIIQRQST
ncbi:MAG: LacI family DNA-binding transcriptional regulator [Acetobacteraceae bacterium]